MTERMYLHAVIKIEPKDEWPGGEPVCATEINTADVVSHMQDWLNDTSKHEGQIPWRVLSVAAESVAFADG